MKDLREDIGVKLDLRRFDLAEAIEFNRKEREIITSLHETGEVSDFSPLCFDRSILNGMNKWDKIRLFYKQYGEEIRKDWDLVKGGNTRVRLSWPELETSHFGFDFYKELSPPEEMAWDVLKNYKTFLLPQFPVKRYFVDFANPFLKIAIEIDGKKWHQDGEKDRVRQSDMEQDGWRFLRFSAIDAMTSKEDAFEREFGIPFEEGEMMPKDEFIEMWQSLRFKNFECFCWWENTEDVLTEGNNWMIDNLRT